MTNVRRLGALLALTASAAGLLTSVAEAQSASRCTTANGRGASPTRVDVWHYLSPADTKSLQQLAREFEASHPGTRVRLEAKGSPLDTAHEFFNAPEGKRPTVVLLPGAATQAAVETGAVTELAPCHTGSPAVVDNLLPGTVAGAEVDHELWGVPFGASGWVLVYDKAAFRRAGLDPNRPPTTLAEVTAASRALMASGAARHGLAIADPTPLAITAGALGTDGAGQRDALVRWEAESRAEGLTVGAIKRDANTGVPGINALVTKEAGMAIENTLALPAAVEALRQGQAPGLELGVAAVPGPSGATTPFVSSAWFLASGTPRAARDAGWAFVEWLSQPEQQARIGGTTDFLPANATVTATTPADRWTTEPLLKQTWSVVSGSRPSAEAPSGALQDREIALAMAFWSFFVHDTTVEAALTDTAARITESDTFYDHGPTHYAQCAFGRPPCVDDVELYAVTVDGGNEVPVARALAAESPSWSPDGRRIVYSLNGHLYVMDGDGTHRVQLTSAAALDRHPDWSPDGTRLVFQRGNTPMGGDLYLLDPVTTVATRLTSGEGVSPLRVWSPDGRHIAYASDRAGSSDVWVMDANGEDPRQVTFDHADDWWPTWSPDGRRLAFMSDRDGDVSVYVIDVDGTNEHRLVPEAVSVPAWSPDGRSIAVVDGLTGEVYLVAADGSTRRRLTTSRGGNFAPSWSPDGTRLILGGTRRG